MYTALKEAIRRQQDDRIEQHIVYATRSVTTGLPVHFRSSKVKSGYKPASLTSWQKPLLCDVALWRTETAQAHEVS